MSIVSKASFSGSYSPLFRHLNSEDQIPTDVLVGPSIPDFENASLASYIEDFLLNTSGLRANAQMSHDFSQMTPIWTGALLRLAWK